MPVSADAGASARSNFWFSFDHGPVHVISGSSEHPYGTGTPQRVWIEAALARATARRAEGKGSADWIIFSVHRPLLCSDGGAAVPSLHAELSPLLQHHGVDVVLTGHAHCYERIHPTYVNGTVASLPARRHAGPNGDEDVYVRPRAPVHVVNGAAGAFQHETWNSPMPAWSAVRIADGFKRTAAGKTGHGIQSYEGSYSYGCFEMVNSTAMRYTVRSIAPRWNLTDTFWIVK